MLKRKIRTVEGKLKKSGTLARTSEEEQELKNFREALNKLDSFQGFELSDQKDVLRNLCKVIADGKLKLNSLVYNMICTMVRTHIPTPVKTSNGSKKIFVHFPEKEVQITEKEYKNILKYQDNEDILRLLTGQIKEESEQPTVHVAVAAD
jgi:hypothetical protein